MDKNKNIVRGLIYMFFYFAGSSCITKSYDFKVVCLYQPVLETALSALNNLRGDNIKYDMR